jgi:hypothetical protein
MSRSDGSPECGGTRLPALPGFKEFLQSAPDVDLEISRSAEGRPLDPRTEEE